MKELISPTYYKANGFEVSDFINAFNLNFNCGNIIKYIVRAGKKQDEDYVCALLKAQAYLNQEIIRAGHEQCRKEQDAKEHDAAFLVIVRPDREEVKA